MNTPPIPTPPPPPDSIFEALTAYQATAAMVSAIELDLFTAVADGNRRIPALARRTGAAERGIRSLCDYLVVAGFLEKRDDAYHLTEVTATYLDRNLPTYIGGAGVFLSSRELRDSFDALGEAVRKGGAAYRDGGTTTSENPVWVDFARAMDPMIRPVASELAESVVSARMATGRILDVAAGHGRFGLEIAVRSDAAQIWALDWPAVLDIASENAAALGIGARFHRIEGSAFDVDWGEGYDLVLLPNFLHHFDQAMCVDLLSRARAALAEGGAVVVLEMVPNEDRVTPPGPAAFGLVMIATTPAGDAYTEAEYRRMFAEAGFDVVTTQEMMGGRNMALMALKG